MAQKMKLTTNSEEASVGDLLSGDVLFSIPYFQRPYKWKTERLSQLEQDISMIVDDDSLTHFLGAVIIHGRRSSPADPKMYDVIDGQQRITTLYLYIMAALRTLCQNNLSEEAAGYFQAYVAIGRKVKNLSNFKLHSCKEDRRQINSVIDDLLSDSKFAVAIQNYLPEKLTDTGPKSGRVTKNYELAKRYFRRQVEQADIERVKETLAAMLERISVVQIDVVDPTNGPKIFDGLNSRQEPMTIGDLVRNDIFSRVSSLTPEDIDRIDAHEWQPFYKKFRISDSINLFDSYFFPYGLIRNPNLSKSEVYNYLRSEWKDLEAPKDIIDGLSVYQDSFLDLVTGSNHQGLTKDAAERVRRYFDFGFPASALPFMMQLTRAIKTGEIVETEGIRILETVEAFLVRRAICGIEPTGLHSVFRRLWTDAGAHVSAETVEQEIRSRSTVTWPNDDFVRKSVRERPIYKTAIGPYLIRQYDKSLGGDVPADIPWVEHVLPQHPVEEWFASFPRDDVHKMMNLWANLIPLSSKMNIDVKNEAYRKKRPSYQDDAMFKSARAFAATHEDWTPVRLEARSRLLAAWTVTRWPG